MAPPSFAASRLINPPGVEPVLTKEQVWKGLEIKVRQPQEFVPVIKTCRIVQDENNTVIRHVQFGSTEAPVVVEECHLYEPTIAYFEMKTEPFGRIVNMVSHDSEGELLLTYSFSKGIPGITKEEDYKDVVKLNEMIGGGVQRSIDVLRKLAKAGRI